MKICNLASGSRGNCTYISAGSTSVLVDNGLTLKELNRRAMEVGLNLRSVSAILVTHEHVDHVRGVAALSDACGIPVYVHARSLERFDKNPIPKDVADCKMEEDFYIGDLCVSPFRLPHDSAYNLGYRIDDGKRCFCLATDLGYVEESVRDKMVGADCVMLESNHDVTMLKQGRYPRYLQARILGKNGHLSNEDCALQAAYLAQKGTRNLILAHLSQDNNTPETAFEQTARTLAQYRVTEGKDVLVDVASQYRPTRIIEL